MKAVLLLVLFAAPLSAQTLTTDKTAYLVNTTMIVSFTGAPGNQKDYIALYPVTTPPTPNANFVQWVYTSGNQNGGRPGITSGSVSFLLNLPTGPYEARFLPNDGLVNTGNVAPFQVTPQVPQVPVVGPNAVLAWAQPATILADAQGYTYRTHLDSDQTGIVVVAVCSGPVSPFSCQTPFPPATPGQHSITMTAANATGPSVPSAPLVFSVVVMVPAAPSGLTVR